MQDYNDSAIPCFEWPQICTKAQAQNFKYQPKEESQSYNFHISFRQQWDPLSNQFKDGTILIHIELSLGDNQIQLTYKTKFDNSLLLMCPKLILMWK